MEKRDTREAQRVQAHPLQARGESHDQRVQILGGVTKVSFDARRPCQIAVLASRMLCLRIISRQHDALTGAASCVRFVLRTGPARAGTAHGDMCDGIGPIGACPRPAHSSRGRSAGRPLSMGARKSRFCACPQRAVRCARDSGPSPIPCQVPGLRIQPLSRAHGRRTSCLRERRKPDFSRFG